MKSRAPFIRGSKHQFLRRAHLRGPFSDLAPASAQMGANRKAMNFDTEF